MALKEFTMYSMHESFNYGFPLIVIFTCKQPIFELLKRSEAEFKEFEPRLKFKPRLKYGWIYLKMYLIFQDLRLRSVETGFWQI